MVVVKQKKHRVPPPPPPPPAPMMMQPPTPVPPPPPQMYTYSYQQQQRPNNVTNNQLGVSSHGKQQQQQQQQLRGKQLQQVWSSSNTNNNARLPGKIIPRKQIQQQQHQQQRSHHQKVKVVPPPPPPPSAAAPLPPPPPQIQHFCTQQQQQQHHGLGSGQNFPSFQSLKLSRTFSNDSSCLSNADSSITNSIVAPTPTQRQIQEQDPGLLSPKLRAYLNNMVTTSGSGTVNNAMGGALAGNRNRSSRNNTTSTSSSIAKQEKNDHHLTKHVLFSPSNLSDTSSKESNDETDVTVLHSIFSPKFHAVSAKKKKMKQQQSHHHQTNLLGEEHASLSQQLASSSLLSPVVVSNNDFSIDVNSVTSDMSDEFGTIHAILRGDTLENIKRHVGLDVEHHPLSPNMTQVIQNGMGAVVVAVDEGNVGVAAVQGVETKIDGVRLNGFICDHAIDATQLLTTNKDEEIDVDDSTEVMLDKARLLTGKALQHNQTRGDQLVGDDNGHLRVVISTSPSAGNSKDSQQLLQQSAIKTPKVTPPANNREDDEDEFFTPSSSMKPNHSFITARAASSPMSLNFDLATTTSRSITAGGSNGLEPVLEEEEMKAKSGHVVAWEDAYQQRFPALGEEESLEEDVNMGDFRTPKQQHASNQDEYDDDDDDEEFFSPLVQHAVHTPASKKLDYQQTDSMLSVTQSVEALPSNIPIPSALPVAKKVSSPNYSEVKQELQTMLKKAKDLSSPSQEQQGQPEQPSFISEMDNLSAIETPLPTSNSLNYSIYSQGANSSIPQSPSFHLHSPSVSSLPRDALTVDFVKQCEDAEILHAIHSLLCDNDNSFSSRNSGKVWGGKQGKQLRYPSLVRLVGKRLHKIEVESLHEIEEEKKEEEQGQQVVHLKPRIAVGMKVPHQSSPRDGVDKENVNPKPLFLPSNELQPAVDPVADGDLTPGSAAPPMESITVLHDSNTEGSVEKEQGAIEHPSRPPSPMSEGLSSLDMNLSESLFTLENESHYWQYSVHSSEGADNKDGDKEHKRGLISEVNVGAKQLKHMETQTEVEGTTYPSYSELNEKLAATLLSNAKLTGEVDSLVKEQLDAKADLTSKLRDITEQMSNLKFAASTQNDTYEKRMSDLDALNSELEDEIHLLNQNAEDRLSQLTSELAEANVRNTALAREKATLQQELNKMRKEVSRIKLMLDKKNAMAVNENTEKLQRVVDSAKLANKALANALAVSERDLAEEIEAKEKSAHECNALQERASELEDKTAFLSSQVKDLSTELKSSHAYIDRLYTEANTRSPSKELKSEFEQKEREWMELESKYSQKIQELESRLVYDSKNKRVSMDAYMEVVKMTRQFKFESTEKDKTIGELKTNVVELRTKLDRMQMPPPTVNKISGGKTIKVLQSMVKSKQVSPGSNDENVAPLPPPPTPAPIQTDTDDLRAKKVQLPQGKQLNRVAAVKAAGGRKGLSEQLRRARRFGGKTHNVKQD